MKFIYTLLALSIILASCGTSNTVTSNQFLQKRKYTSGWYFNHSTNVVSSNEESINEKSNLQSSVSSIIKTDETIKLDEIDSIETSACDSIILMDRKIVRAYILSETDSTILYTKCDSDDPSEFTIDKKNIKAVQYANGKFEILKHGPTPAEIHQTNLENFNNKKKEKEASSAPYLIFLTLGILFLTACVFSFGVFLILFVISYAYIKSLVVLSAVLIVFSMVFFMAFAMSKAKYDRQTRLNNAKTHDK